MVFGKRSEEDMERGKMEDNSRVFLLCDLGRGLGVELTVDFCWKIKGRG